MKTRILGVAASLLLVACTVNPEGGRERAAAESEQAADSSAGVPGGAGRDGVAGPQGDPGADGATGPQGDPGPKGARGLQGDPGAKGAMGPKGNSGADGAPGAEGDTGATGAAGPQGETGATGATGAAGPKGDTGEAGPGSVGTSYTLPGTGGVWLGSYLSLRTASGRASLNLTCNYGLAGENNAYFFAEDPSVAAGSILVTVAMDGRPLLAFRDLAYNQGGQDFAFPFEIHVGTWGWHGVFTVDDLGSVPTLTRWDVTMLGSSSGDCTAIVYATGGAPGSVVQP